MNFLLINNFSNFQKKKKKLVLFFIIIILILTLNNSSVNAAKKETSLFKNNYSNSRLVPIYKVNRDDNKIALTVDGAWGSNKTEDLLNLFSKENIPVSFFFAGIWLEDNPQLVKKILKAGHEIYNHSYSHPHFNNLNKNEILSELRKTEKIISKFYGKKSKKKYFRAPYGEYNNLLVKTAREEGYQLIQWSLDSHDWMDPGKEYILSRIKNDISSGDILLFHNNSENIVEILSELISELKKNYQFVKIENLIYNNNYQINSLTGIQYKIKDDDNGNKSRKSE